MLDECKSDRCQWPMNCYKIFFSYFLQFVDMAVFALGALIGITTFSRFLSYLLKRYEVYTISFLIGMMIGALRLPYDKISESYTSLFPVIAAVFLGFALVVGMQFFADKYITDTTKAEL